MSANVGYVGHKANHLVAPVEGNQPLPGVGDPVDLGADAAAPSAVRDRTAHHQHLHDRRRAAAATTTRCRSACRQRNVKGVEYLASYTLGRVRTNNLGYYGSARRGGRGRLLDEHLRAGVELRPGVLRRPAQPRVVGELRAAVRPRTQVGHAMRPAWSMRSSAAGG